MILRSRLIVTMDGTPLVDGALWIVGNRIEAIGTFSELEGRTSEPVLDLGDQVLLPGLINAHCHLDYSMMRNAISPPTSFTAWVQRINAIKRSLDSEEYLAAIARGFAELKRWGTTTVCNIEAFPELMPSLPPDPIRTWWFYEMIDIRHRITTDDVVAGALTFFKRQPQSLGGFGLNPHAPYTASQQLYHLANGCADRTEMLLTTHVAESCEELAMFMHARGPLFDFMTQLKRPMADCGETTPFQMLWKSGAIDANWILAHMNELTEEDFELLATLPALAPDGGPHIVYCPGSHRYFGHSEFPFRRLHDMGMNICVGTDSLASTDSLSLLRELRRVRQSQPWLNAESLLATVTRNSARALKRIGQLGQIIPGALADLIALPTSGTLENVYDEIVNYERPIAWMMINGEILS